MSADVARHTSAMMTSRTTRHAIKKDMQTKKLIEGTNDARVEYRNYYEQHYKTVI